MKLITIILATRFAPSTNAYPVDTCVTECAGPNPAVLTVAQCVASCLQHSYGPAFNITDIILDPSEVVPLLPINPPITTDEKKGKQEKNEKASALPTMAATNVAVPKQKHDFCTKFCRLTPCTCNCC